MPAAPILEFDPSPTAFIEPARAITPRDMPEHCVITFFKDVMAAVVEEKAGRQRVENRWEDGPHPIYEIQHRGRRLAFMQGGIGAALSAALLEKAIGFGGRKFIACGGCATVEMEAAGPLAVAEFRGAPLGYILYGGDDLSGPEWDRRGWQSRAEVRRQLFWLAADACVGR